MESFQRDQAHFTDSFATLNLSPHEVVSLSLVWILKIDDIVTLFQQEPKEGQAVYSPHKGQEL